MNEGKHRSKNTLCLSGIFQFHSNTPNYEVKTYPRNWLKQEDIISQNMWTTFQKDTMKSYSASEAKNTDGSHYQFCSWEW